jgi:hypothetical protein
MNAGVVDVELDQLERWQPSLQEREAETSEVTGNEHEMSRTRRSRVPGGR